MSDQRQIIIALLSRYDYGGVYSLLDDLNVADSDFAKLVKSCRQAVNFDFDGAIEAIYEMDKEMLTQTVVVETLASLRDLKEGSVEALFSEMMANIKMQLINDEYIDFLGRIYRFKEAILKYIFIKHDTKRGHLTLNMEMMQKRYQLKRLRSKYKIFNNNICYGITTYFRKYAPDNYQAQQIIKLLNSEKMDVLIELRNDSIVGHGFKGVSRAEIAKAFGNPDLVLEDFQTCLSLLKLKIDNKKYSRLNDYLKTLANDVTRTHALSALGNFE